AKGIQLTAFGRNVTDYRQIDLPVPIEGADGLEGAVLHVDRFGNLVTNIDRKLYERFAGTHTIELAAGGHPVRRLVATYAEIQAGEVCGLFGSTDHLEFAA